MATRTYLIFKENGKEVLNTQIFGNNFWDGKSRGTKNDIELSEKYNVPLRIVKFR